MFPTASPLPAPGFRRRSVAGRRPTFLYIGTPKAGSTWIYNALREHPQVFIPVGGKDVNFFNDNYHRGWDWYLRQFRKAGTALAVGEVSHDYYLSEQAARRIRADLPDVRLICCLREPGDFAVSALRWWHNHTRRFGANFKKMTEHPVFMDMLSYRKKLEPYFDLFPRNRILVAFYEHLKDDPPSFTRQLYEFAGVSPYYQPAVLTTKSNLTRPARNRAALAYAFEAAQLLRRIGAGYAVNAVKQSWLFDRAAYTAADRCEAPSVKTELTEIADGVRRRIASELEPIAELIGRPLPSEWLKAAHGCA